METFDNPNSSTQKMVFWILALFPLAYLGILYLLDTMTFDASAEPSDLPFDFLASALIIMALIEIIVVVKVLTPSISTKTDVNERYGMMLMGSVLYGSIAIYGILLGILQIFILVEHVNWLISGSFIILSMLLQVIYIQTTVNSNL